MHRSVLRSVSGRLASPFYRPAAPLRPTGDRGRYPTEILATLTLMAVPTDNAYSPPQAVDAPPSRSRWRFVIVAVGCFFCLGYGSLLAYMPTADYSTPDDAVSDNVRLGRTLLSAWFYVLCGSALAATLFATISAYRGRWIRGLMLIIITFTAMRLLSRFGTPFMLDVYEFLFPL